MLRFLLQQVIVHTVYSKQCHLAVATAQNVLQVIDREKLEGAYKSAADLV